mgnify:CR=1 FL=1
MLNKNTGYFFLSKTNFFVYFFLSSKNYLDIDFITQIIFKIPSDSSNVLVYAQVEAYIWMNSEFSKKNVFEDVWFYCQVVNSKFCLDPSDISFAEFHAYTSQNKKTFHWFCTSSQAFCSFRRSTYYGCRSDYLIPIWNSEADNSSHNEIWEAWCSALCNQQAKQQATFNKPS